MCSASPVSSGSDLSLGAVLLASGTSSRFGKNKLLAEFDGRPLFEWAFSAIPKDLFRKVAVVTAYEEISERAKEEGFDVVWNSAPERGQGRSIASGIRVMDSLDACMFLVCDQPYVSSSSIRKLASEFSGGITALSFYGRRGNPVLFSSRFFPELASVPDHKTGSFVIRRHPDAVSLCEAECAVELEDIDDEDELRLLSSVKNFFLTGAKRVGKSTAISRILGERSIVPSGILTLPYSICGHHTGHYLHALSEDVPPEENDKPVSVYVPPSSCIPIPDTFSVFGTKYAACALLDGSGLVLLDELGRLETPAKGFRDAVFALLESKKPVIGVLKEGSIPWLEEIRAREDTRVVRLLEDHRDEAICQITRFLDSEGLRKRMSNWRPKSESV